MKYAEIVILYYNKVKCFHAILTNFFSRADEVKIAAADNEFYSPFGE